MAEYSLVHLTNALCPPAEMLHVAAEAGFDCVSFRIIPTRTGQEKPESVSVSKVGQTVFDLVRDKQMVADIKRAAQDTGVRINDTENARIFAGGEVKNYEADLEVAAELGIKHILTNIWTDDKPFYVDQFGQLCDLAAQYGQSVNLEFVTWAGVKDVRSAAEVLRAADRPNMGMVVDTIHYYRSRVQLSDLDGLPQEWFRYTHLCDCPAEIPADLDELIRSGLEDRLFPGEGCIDFKALLAKIPHVVRGIEVPNKKRLAEMGYVKYAAAALQATKAYFGD